ncbi:alpha/beta hydrolase [Schumannella luteola]|uniref:Pimeloyl-ACP methyl ester carboxylesterase n=1 Tax=Schumannella luteola TaxID=472059 RepID=A0A852YJ38_9MICO|nr:alpha/beta hydrolase [Schumannella luteola]NYG99957.1 pimeloyl-ACP methyl ester carboxylesterase [Schumannella luteola]TPX05499.1 alpha/beta hydrolase [Schumannella luteola]
MPVASPYAAQLAALPTRTGEVDARGSRTRYWDYGPADAPVALVVVHGYRGDHHGLEPVLAQLPGLRIIAPDLPGFGESTPMAAGEHSIAGYAAWLGEFLDALDLRGTVPLLGHSFGSIVVAHALAAGLPTPRLILVNPISTDPMSGVNGALARLTRLYYTVGRKLPSGAGGAWLGNPLVVRFMSVTLAKTPDATLKRWIHEEHGRYFSGFSDRDTLAEGFDASLSTDVTRAADALTMPTLLIAGAEDMIAPLTGQHALLTKLPDARLVELPGVGHLIHYERPQQAAAEIERFLGEGPDAGGTSTAGDAGEGAA